jgi:multicomponent Na+:H+ antiporter subunit G
MNTLALVLFLMGAVWLTLAALGSIKFPDFFTRTASISKSSTLGLFLCVLAAAVQLETREAMIKALILIVFLFIANPVAAHLLARSALRRGIKLFRNTRQIK